MRLIKWNIFILLLLSGFVTFSQTYSDTTWQRWYGIQNQYDIPREYYHTLHYDGGIIFISHPNNPYEITLTKTDVNGYFLWSKKIESNVQLSTISITSLEDGSIIGVGSYIQNNISSPLIYKLNSCGELVWCKKMFSETNSFAMAVKEDYNQDIVVLIYEASPNIEISCQLIKLDIDGELIWQNSCLNYEDYPNVSVAQIIGLNISNENTYLLSGNCVNNGLWQPIVLLIDENGKFIWNLPIEFNGDCWSFNRTCLTENNEYIASCYVNYLEAPCLYKFNLEGELTSLVIDTILNSEVLYAGPTGFNLVNDNGTFTSILSYWVNENVYDIRRGYITYDDSLHVINYSLIDNFDYPFSSMASLDNKFINISSFPETIQEEFYDVYLTKYNADLSFADTIDDTTWEYDYLCDDPIVSDTIYLACDPIGIEEMHPLVDQAKDELPLQISVNPNPARNQVKLQWEYLTPSEDSKELSLQIFDIKGNEMYQEQLNRGDHEIDIKTRKWQSGLYIVIMRSEGIMIGNAKFVIEK